MSHWIGDVALQTRAVKAGAHAFAHCRFRITAMGAVVARVCRGHMRRCRGGCFGRNIRRHKRWRIGGQAAGSTLRVSDVAFEAVARVARLLADANRGVRVAAVGSIVAGMIGRCVRRSESRD